MCVGIVIFLIGALVGRTCSHTLTLQYTVLVPSVKHPKCIRPFLSSIFPSIPNFLFTPGKKTLLPKPSFKALKSNFSSANCVR